jgi:hypothetical protein
MVLVKIIIHINGAQKLIIFINKFIIQSYHPHQWCTEMYNPNLSSTAMVLKLRIKRALSAACSPGAQARKRRVRLTLLPL